MMATTFEAFNGMPMQFGLVWILVWIITLVWSFIWKGFALWISAREGKKRWFIPILIFNTLGILEIIYIFFFSKAGKKFLQKMKEGKSKTKNQLSEQ